MTPGVPAGWRLAVLLALFSGMAACAPVHAWQKGALAQPGMAFEGDRLDARLSEHIYTNRESASGGAGVGGGGCGCN